MRTLVNLFICCGHPTVALQKINLLKNTIQQASGHFEPLHHYITHGGKFLQRRNSYKYLDLTY